MNVPVIMPSFKVLHKYDSQGREYTDVFIKDGDRRFHSRYPSHLHELALRVDYAQCGKGELTRRDR